MGMKSMNLAFQERPLQDHPPAGQLSHDMWEGAVSHDMGEEVSHDIEGGAQCHMTLFVGPRRRINTKEGRTYPVKLV